MIYDVAIIGAGPGGISAAIYAKRSGLSVIVFESKMIGGLLNYTNVVDNYPGFSKISGPDLAFKMNEHFKTFDIEYKNENVIDIKDGEVKTVATKSGEYSTRNVIIATGRSRRSLGVKGEEELKGHGISYCAMCDGNFYKGKKVAVVGAGDSSLEESIYLSNIVDSVTILVRGSRLSGSQTLIDEVEKRDNIEVEFGVSIQELKSEEGKLSGVVLTDGQILKVDGIFVYIGFDPVLPFETELNIKRDRGYIVVNENFETSISGIYAIGDIIKKDLYQIIAAEYEGAMAATHISKQIDKGNK
ncbi:MAG TPA: thioredoxin-disulfide reductase [Firmicutes bacterium]|nr:thioredoxin-disulfide reductase [Bacillota bacterium]